jgi:hypothetical protein
MKLNVGSRLRNLILAVALVCSVSGGMTVVESADGESQPGVSAAASPPAPATVNEAPEDPRAQAIWKMLSGRWERKQIVPGKGEFRLEKIVSEGQEILVVCGPDGTVLREQRADLKLERRGNLWVLGWSKAHVTAGPEKGSPIGDGTTVIKVEPARWIMVTGLAENEPWGLAAEVWTRVPEPPGKA